jgi:homoserine acetyltransferase
MGPFAPSQQQLHLTHPSPTPSASLNPFLALVPSQKVAALSEYTLESGVQLRQVEVAYRTWGKLNEACDNVMVICHALTGSSDVEDWSVGITWDRLRLSLLLACKGR